MVSPLQLDAARSAKDRHARTEKMAGIMRDRAAVDGACKSQDLRAAGFTEAEIWAYADDARAILSGRSLTFRNARPPGRAEGEKLVRIARRIRKQMGGRFD